MLQHIYSVYFCMIVGALQSDYNPYGDNPHNLCDLCVGTSPNNCARSHDEPYYDYQGAFR